MTKKNIKKKPDSSDPYADQNDPAQERAGETPKRRFSIKFVLICLLVLGVAVSSTYAIIYFNESALREAEEYLANNDPAPAIVLIEEFLKDNPNNGRALTLKARALTLRGEFAEACEIYKRTGTPKLIDMKLASRGFVQLQQWQNAMPLLVGVLGQEPDNAEALYAITRCQYMLGLWENAKESATGLMKVPGNERTGMIMMAAIEGNAQNDEAAAEWYEKALNVS